jgi:hypothetical protein
VFSERVAAAAVGVVLGALIGVALAWVLGVARHPAATAHLTISFAHAALAGAAVFGAIGAVFGASVGTLLGHAIAAMVSPEWGDGPHVPRWAVVVVLAGAAAAAVWFARGRA